MKIFLTGGTGFIGQPLTRSLLKRGWDVTVLVRKPESQQAQSLGRMGAQLTTGDVTNRESMRAAMREAEVVVHNAGQYEYGLDNAGKERMRRVNVEGTENVLSLAQELNIPRTVYVSTLQAFGQTGTKPCDETYARQSSCYTTYEQTKTDAHEVACHYQACGLPLIIVCPHQVIGPNDHSPFGYFLRLYINRIMPPMAWSPDAIFCCVDVNDLVEGIKLAVEKGRLGETYIFCGDRQNFRDVFECWGKRPGAFLPRLWMPPRLAAAFFAPLGPIQRILGLPAFISGDTVRASAKNWYYTCEKAKRELGWTHRSADAMWDETIDGEIQLLARRKSQKLVERLKPLAVVE